MNQTKTNDQEVSLRAYARHRGVALSAVQKAIRSGRISKTASGKINAAQADRDWNQNTDIARRPADAVASAGSTMSQDLTLPTGDDDEPAEMPAGAEYQRHRSNRERIRAEREQIELDKLAGRSVDLADAQRIAFTAFRTVRDAVLNVSPRIKDALAAESDPLRVESMLDAELVAALQSIDLTTILQEKDDEDMEDGSD